MPQGTGRTDAGVHARAQGVLVHMGREWDPYRLLAAFNAHLERDVRIMDARPAPEGFFPRAHAVAKRYVYRIQEGPAEDPFLRPFRWHVHGAEALDRAASEAGLRTTVAGRFGPHYAETLRRWRERFTDNAAAVSALGFGEEFRRMWEFYLAYCQAGFAAGYLDVAHLVLD